MSYEFQIPVSVLVMTRNEEANIARCLEALDMFEEIIVVDSRSDDRTGALAREAGAEVVSFAWNGKYPKKRQWCLENLALAHEWVLFVDADEEVTPSLVYEIKNLFERGEEDACAGYFIRGQYVWGERTLEHGMQNNKIALFNRRKMWFPVVDDLDIKGMGEIEGHYQPVLKAGHEGEKIGKIRAPLLHYAYKDAGRWAARHEGYAQWEAQMTRKCAWPVDPVPWREAVKSALRASPLRPYLVFCYSYLWKWGFLDGQAGFAFAKSRYAYAKAVLRG